MSYCRDDRDEMADVLDTLNEMYSEMDKRIRELCFDLFKVDLEKLNYVELLNRLGRDKIHFEVMYDTFNGYKKRTVCICDGVRIMFEGDNNNIGMDTRRLIDMISARRSLGNIKGFEERVRSCLNS